MVQAKMDYNLLIEMLINQSAYKATHYINPKMIIRAVRKRFTTKTGKKRIANSRANLEVIITCGRPNYIEREFIKKCIKAKEPFPVKKIQLKF